MTKASKLLPKVQEPAMRMVVLPQGQHDSKWTAIESIAAKIDSMADALRRTVRQHWRNTGRRRV
jgi:hypothetical protein